MYCLKCGRDTENEHVFCDNCLEIMDRYPVKPGTAVHLPHRKDAAGKKPSRKRTVSPEEQIAGLKKTLRRSRICALVLFLALSLVAVLLVRQFANGDVPAIGQNYTIDTNWEVD